VGMFNKDETKGKWKQVVGAAKVNWGKLTEDELLQTEGHADKLAGKVQEQYGISREQARKQVDDFFSKQKH
jgi:uncharacterized protein YjbJ (UPF0337 family)